MILRPRVSSSGSHSHVRPLEPTPCTNSDRRSVLRPLELDVEADTVAPDTPRVGHVSKIASHGCHADVAIRSNSSLCCHPGSYDWTMTRNG